MLPPPEGLRRCWALLSYEGVGRELVARLKYRNGRSVLDWLAVGMAGLVPEGDGTPFGLIDVVTWAPTLPGRAASRGYDQAALLARRVARHLGRPCRRVLTRRPGEAQTGQSAAARSVGPDFAVRSGQVQGRGVLVVDDVVTTGATLRAAARALRDAGVADVSALAAARTPLKVSCPATDP